MNKKTIGLVLAILAIASAGAGQPSAWSYEIDIFDMLPGGNNTPESATPLGDIGSSPLFFKQLTIDHPDDVDYFAWTPKFSDTLQIDILFEHSKFGDLDTILRRSYISVDQSDSLTDNEQIIADVVAGETYLLKVYGYSGSTNSYDLGISYVKDGKPGGGGGDNPGGGDPGGEPGGGTPPDPIVPGPVPPTPGGEPATKLIALLDYIDMYIPDRTVERFLRSPVQHAIKQLNAGAPTETVTPILESVVNSPLGFRERGSAAQMINHVKASTVNILNEMSASAGMRVYFQAPRLFFRAVAAEGVAGDGQTSVGYDPSTGEVWVDAPAGTELTSINIDSVSGIFTGDAASNLGGSFDNSSEDNVFKATFGSSFGSLTFGQVAQPGLAQEFLLEDLTVVGSLAGGGDLGDVDLIYVPEPTAWALASLGLFGLLTLVRRDRRNAA